MDTIKIAGHVVSNGTHWHMPDRSMLAIEPGDLVRYSRQSWRDGMQVTTHHERAVKEVKKHRGSESRDLFFEDGGQISVFQPDQLAEVFRPRAKMRNGWRSDSPDSIEQQVAMQEPKPKQRDSRKPRTSDGEKHEVRVTKSSPHGRHNYAGDPR